MMKIRVLNGPNLNLLGTREPDVYGCQTLEDIEKKLDIEAQSYGIKLDFFQSNHEGEIIDSIHEAFISGYDGLIINAGALTHYSLAIRDAISGVKRSASFQYSCPGGISLKVCYCPGLHGADQRVWG